MGSPADPPSSVERRREPRSTPSGTATVLARRNQTLLYVVRNLSRSGALLVGEGALAPDERVHVLLQLDRNPLPIAMRARVVRCDAAGEGHAVAVEFLIATGTEPSP